ncbi:hypothetical protein HBI49_222310 [Parastagonospora nodorum]|nr:hypothetical protein HBI71_228430 [Parastagonospora nodorum]KAH5344657.1 hypothetical protein HBI49_222310 [Parastagonospora nodorum]KAH5485030.1 hypothetical protein HBI29_232830 [Parastagonospora nodorum]KAH5594341.1 hypothetical protein HBI45_191330 [Parastagonospora nodorum]KAH5665050.1 hypothetical protein HBI44_227550 [Parastagonospora nodorum]
MAPKRKQTHENDGRPQSFDKDNDEPPKSSDEKSGYPPQLYTDDNGDLLQPSEDNNHVHPQPPNDVRQMRSASRKLQENIPTPDGGESLQPKRAKNRKPEPQQTKRAKRGDNEEPERSRLLSEEGLTPAEINAALEQQKKLLREELRAAAAAAEIPGFDFQKQKQIQIRHEETPANQRNLIKEVNKAVEGADSFKTQNRMDKHQARTAATAKYEDSLHFRVPERRKQYNEHIDQDGELIKKAFRDKAAPVLWIDSGHYGEALRTTFESYERHNVGMTETINIPALDPNELHLIVPAARRFPVGLGRAHPPVVLAPINMGLNFDTIERRRASIEDNPAEEKNVAVDGIAMLETHTQRRARQMQPFREEETEDNEYRRTVPTNLYVHDTIPTARNLDKTFLETGVFISAGESSYNWNDSYDQTDIVKPGYLAVEEGMVVETQPGENDAPPRSPSPGPPVSQRQIDEGVEGLLWEFVLPRPEQDKTYELVPTTTWAENTYGRREREHAYMDIRPPSPVLSPPHSPIFPAKTAANTFHVPADIPRNHANFRNLRSKFKDKYSVNFQDWPSFKQAPEGEGKEVIYEPLDIAALQPNQQKRWGAGAVLLDSNGRFALPAPEGTSMRLYREAFKTPYEPPVRPEGLVQDEESDDEGDLFRLSYLECSGVQGSRSAPQGDGGAVADADGGGGP